MNDLFESKHKQNIEKIDGIHISIDEYLDIMQKVWDYRILSLRKEAILKWKQQFNSCKENLNQNYQGVTFSLSSINTHFLASNLSVELFNSILSTNMFQTSNTSLDQMNYNTVVLKQTNEELIRAALDKSKEFGQALTNLLPRANEYYQKYVHWIGKNALNDQSAPI